jgi:two-component system, OmpR family, response regulator MtrA
MAFVNLLIVEENEAMCRLLGTLLEGLPVSVSECHDGARALEACAEMQPDYVVIDLNLAGMEAFTAIRRIVAAHRDVRVLLLGDENDSRLRDGAAEAGVWRYVLKESLIDVRRLLEPMCQDSEDRDAGERRIAR